MASVVWSPQALGDVARIAAYIAAENPVAAARVARELLVAGDSLVVFPRRGRPTSLRAGLSNPAQRSGGHPAHLARRAGPPRLSLAANSACPPPRPQANIASGIFAQETGSVSAAECCKRLKRLGKNAAGPMEMRRGGESTHT